MGSSSEPRCLGAGFQLASGERGAELKTLFCNMLAQQFGAVCRPDRATFGLSRRGFDASPYDVVSGLYGGALRILALALRSERGAPGWPLGRVGHCGSYFERREWLRAFGVPGFLDAISDCGEIFGWF